MKFIYDKELFQRYYKDILKNMALLLLISSLSVIAPLLLRNAMDIAFQGGFRAGMLFWYLQEKTFLAGIVSAFIMVLIYMFVKEGGESHEEKRT